MERLGGRRQSSPVGKSLGTLLNGEARMFEQQTKSVKGKGIIGGQGINGGKK